MAVVGRQCAFLKNNWSAIEKSVVLCLGEDGWDGNQDKVMEAHGEHHGREYCVWSLTSQMGLQVYGGFAAAEKWLIL